MLKKKKYMIGAAVCFFLGAYTWKIANTGRHAARLEDITPSTGFSTKATLIFVGEEAISTEDLEWEYRLHTMEIKPSPQLTPIPDYGEKAEQYLTPLKEALLSSIIERKLLFQFIGQDPEFSLGNATRFTNCLHEWQEATKNPQDFLKNPKDRERLKERLCQQSILLQYLDEKIYPRAKVTDQEIFTYFNNHKNEFTRGPQVILHQILSATEGDAKKVMAKVNAHNFEDMAREYSIAPEAEKGGLLGPFTEQQLPHLFEVAFSMRTGEIRGILKSPYGFHIVKLDKKIPRTSLGFRDAEPRIRETLLKKKREEEYQKWVEVALSAIHVKTPRPLW